MKLYKTISGDFVYGKIVKQKNYKNIVIIADKFNYRYVIYKHDI